MPYHLKPGEPVSVAIRRIVSEEIESAELQLSGKGEPNRDEAIHEARKHVKKIRGVLRLMQPELGATFGVENIHFRDIGRKLSHFRDAGAMLEIFDALLKEHRADLGRRKLASIRRGLLARKNQSEHQNDIEKSLHEIAGELRDSASRVQSWPLKEDGFGSLAPGLKATFRRGRKALARVRECPLPEAFHDWRKRVKEHWYHVRLLESFWSGETEAHEKCVKELETALGEDHNLVLLRERMEAEPLFYGKPTDVDRLLKLIEKYQKKLRDQAIDLGGRIYEEKPRKLAARLRRLWEARKTPSENGQSTGPAASEAGD